MIVAVKRKKKGLLLKVVAVLALIGMFTAYYFHMGNEFKEFDTNKQEHTLKKVDKSEYAKRQRRAAILEDLIFKEAEKAVELLEQRNVQSVKIVEDKLLIVCDPNTNLEPLMVRYGVEALIKSSRKDVKIAIDLKFIVESNYDVKKL